MRVLIFFLAISVHTIQAQNYTVIHVIGKIYDTSTSSYLKSGSKLSESSELKFETSDARAAALSSSRGRYVIQKQSNQSGSNDLAYTLSAVLAPARGKMSTRAGGINNQMDFAKKFGENPVAIVGGTYSTAISNTAYPSDENRFFYASYLYKGESINKKLDVINGELQFDVKTFYAVDGVSIDPNETSDCKLFYYDSDKEESMEITSLDFNIVNDEDLKSMISSLEDTSPEEQITSLQEIISSLYGSCDETQLKATVEGFN